MNIRRYILLSTCFFVFCGMSAFAQLETIPEVPDSHQNIESEITSGSTPNKISLDLKGVDIIDVLKMLSARSDLNIVAGRNVKGKVTLFLKDVNIWDAFEIILAANDLAYDKQGNIINVMTERDYEQLYGERYYDKKELRAYRLEYAKAADIGKALNQTKSKIGKVVVDEGSNTIVLIDSPRAVSAMEDVIKKMDIPTETKVFRLNYAKAEDLKTKLSEILTKGVGTMQVDERTNKIVVTDLSRRMPDISSVIEEMDEKHKEVLIEAKIVQIELNDEYKYGVDWKGLFNKLSNEGVRFNFDNLGDVFGGSATGGTLTVANMASRYLDVVIEVLQTVGKTNVISNPRITVLNNEEARVLVGTNQPYVTTTTTVPEGGQSITAESITYIDVGVTLTVTPTISRDGFVTMKIKPEVSSLGTPLSTASGNEIPVVSTSETETTVMVQDGTTIIIAGLIEDRDIESEDKVPILGDIPIIGNLFKNKTIGSTTLPEKKELVIFLTPYIIYGTETFAESENVWYSDSLTQHELLEQQMSLAVEDLKRKRSIAERGLPQPSPPKKDTTTRLAKDLKWFGWGKEPKKEEESKELKPEEIKPEEVKPEKAEPSNAKRGKLPEKIKVDKEKKEEAREIPVSQPIPTTTVGEYNIYLESLRNKILWVTNDNYPENLKGKREDVMVLFTLTSDGMLKGEPEVLNKVDEKVAKAAKNAVKKAAPFPPFPKEIKKNLEAFLITITYE